MRIIASIKLALASAAISAQTTHVLQSGNMQFIPAQLTIEAGDCIALTLVADHTATEVSQETWEANGNIPNGGFNFGPGTPNPGLFHEFCIDEPGTYHYVCIPHVSLGMKGRIIVTGSMGMHTHTSADAQHIAPNPASDHIHLTIRNGPIDASVIDAVGRTVKSIHAWDGKALDIRDLNEGRYLLLLGAQRIPFVVLR